jgi:CP family cyanate transporter-like MFS transporter
MSRRSANAWLVALFFGLQSMVYYGVLAWLAPLYEDRGWSKPEAGLLLALFTASQIVGSMTASVAVERTGRLVAGLRITALATALGLFLVALTPMSAPWLWATVLGLGAGGIFTLALTVPLAVTATVDEARRLTATTLCYGYLLAATGPFVVSVLRSLSGSFTLAFGFLAVISCSALGVARSAVARQEPTRAGPAARV